MGLSNLIQEFLSGKLSYTEGVDLYKRIGKPSSFYIKLFETEDDFSHNKLRNELQKVLNTLENKQVHSEQKSSIKPGNKKINPDVLPHHLRLEYEKLGNIIRQISFNHAKLEERNKPERYKLAEEIIKLTEQRRVIYSRCDYFMENGRDLPQFENNVEEKTIEEIPLFEALHKLQLLRVQRTKLKKLPARVEDYKLVLTKIESLEKHIKKLKNA